MNIDVASLEITEFLTQENFDVVSKTIEQAGLRSIISCNYEGIAKHSDLIRGKIMQLIGIMNKNGVCGHFWMVANPEVCWALEENIKELKGKAFIPMGYKGIELIGTLDRRVLVFSSDKAEKIIIGCGVPENIQENSNYALLSLYNL